MLNKLICWLKGHKRGKKVGIAVKPDGSPHFTEFALYECPRCGGKWNRKFKA